MKQSYFTWDERGLAFHEGLFYSKINQPVLIKKGPTSVLKRGRYTLCYLVMVNEQDIVVEERYLASEPFEGYMRDFLGAKA